ncbi:MAG: hypothetical protein AAF641_06655 [Pseudomonadota bacterium]
MLTAVRHFFVHALTTLAVLAVMVSLGFGHHLRTSDAPPDPAAQAFLDAGGSLSDLCDEGTGEHAKHVECPMCQLAGGLMLPTPGAHCVHIIQAHTNTVWPQAEGIARQHQLAAANKSRAPPRA